MNCRARALDMSSSINRTAHYDEARFQLYLDPSHGTNDLRGRVESNNFVVRKQVPGKISSLLLAPIFCPSFSFYRSRYK